MALVMIMILLMQVGAMNDDLDDPESQARWLNDLSMNPLDPNSASADELSRLPGIDPRLARAIVAYRTRRGAFRDISEMARVPGIDAELVEAIRPYVRIRWRDAWNPTGAAFLRHGQFRGHATAGPFSVFHSDSRRFGSFSSPTLTLIAGDHRVSTGLGLVQHHGFRAENSVFGHNRHGTRIRGNTSSSTSGGTTLAGTVRARGFELSAFETGGRLHHTFGDYGAAITTSSGAISHDGSFSSATVPVGFAYEIATHEGKTAWMVESRIVAARRFRIHVRQYRIGTGYDAPHGMIAVRFGKKPMGETGLGVGLKWNGWHAGVLEARSKNRDYPETDISYRLGYSDSKKSVDWTNDRIRGVARFGASGSLRGEVGLEKRGRSVGGRTVLEVEPAKGYKVWAMLGVFDAEAYTERLYGWEPDGYRRGKIVLWYGRGRRGVVSVQAEPWKGLVISAKYGVTHYADRWGPDAVKSEAVIQMDWGF